MLLTTVLGACYVHGLKELTLDVPNIGCDLPSRGHGILQGHSLKPRYFTQPKRELSAPAFSPLSDRGRGPVPGVTPPAVGDRVPLGAAEHVAQALPEFVILQHAKVSSQNVPSDTT